MDPPSHKATEGQVTDYSDDRLFVALVLYLSRQGGIPPKAVIDLYLIMNFFYFIAAEILGFVCVLYAKWIRDNTGIRFEFAEKVIGGGGTIIFIKFLGILFIAAGFWLLFI